MSSVLFDELMLLSKLILRHGISELPPIEKTLACDHDGLYMIFFWPFFLATQDFVLGAIFFFFTDVSHRIHRCIGHVFFSMKKGWKVGVRPIRNHNKNLGTDLRYR